MLLSGIFFDKRPEKLIRLGIDGKIKLIIPKLVIEEANEKMAEKKIFKDRYQDSTGDFIKIIEKACEETSSDILDNKEFSVKCRDKDDELIINHACKIKPDYFITGDEDLLVIENPPIRICTLVNFLKEQFPEELQ